MTIELPKTVKTYLYPPLTVFTTADTDVDRVLPHLFEACVKGGRPTRIHTDARNYPGYLATLLASDQMVGFESPDASALVDGWLRSCIIDMGTVGKSHSEEQMLSVAPITLAAYRAGVPRTRSRHRFIDDVTYQLLRAEVARKTPDANPDGALRRIIGENLGHGLRIGPPPKWEPELIEPDKLDISALLEFRFLEGFEMGEVREFKSGSKVLNSPLPGVTDKLGKMLLAHLLVYSGRLPTAALMSTFAGLLALGLFTLSLRINAAGQQLLRTGRAPADMAEADPNSPLELYCDFTGGIDDESDKISRQCVERDLNQIRLVFRDRMTFMIADKAIERIVSERERRHHLSGPEKLVQLAELREHQQVELFAMSQLYEIDAINPRDSESLTEDEANFLDNVKRSDKSELDRLLDVLEFVNHDKATRNTVSWFHSVGGLRKPYGILTGASQNRRSWRYAPSDELLQILLLAVFVRDHGACRPTMPLQQLLDELRHRFGILVDRPPAFLDGAEARAAAAANLAAFKRRLQLLGCFDSLSDDFSEQIVRHPLGDRDV
ncbi:methylation-associated defense system protein MAD7 [Saccharothrix isguenensis]